jgi:peptide/nickel transport system permease protein
MATSTLPGSTDAPAAKPGRAARRAGRRPNPKIEQYRRTWYFLRRNTLALIGLGIIICLVLMAVYALTQPIAWYAMPQYCASSQTNPTNTTTQTSTEIIINPDLNGLPNGTYSWSVWAKGLYVANPTVGTMNVNGQPVNVVVKFAQQGAAVATSSVTTSVAPSIAHTSNSTVAHYTVTFTETGLPKPPDWSVLMNFTSPNVCGSLGSTPIVCTYPQGSQSPGPNCYQTPKLYESIIGPTFNLGTLQGGPLPLGALTQGASEPYFYNLYDGLLRGTDWSLMISVSIVGAGAFLGLLIGAIAGFYGGLVDEALMRLVDIFLSIPQLLFVLITVAAVTLTVHQIPPLSAPDTKIFLLVVAFIIVWWPFYSRIVRGQVLVVREQKYVEAARASGASGGRIVRRHIIPNSLFPVFIQMSLDVGTIPLLTGALVFLGFNIFPTLYFPEWGSISALGVVQLPQFLVTCELASGCVIPWWQIAFPGILLFLFAISVNFLSDGLRDALDPRLRR